MVSRDDRLLVAPEDRGLAVVFQDLALWPHLTVEGNLGFGLAARGMPARQRAERIAAMLGRVGLAGTERRYPGDLSGGQRQRVAIARALVTEPRAVLLDEPLASVDVDLRRELLELLRELFRENGTTAIHVTHDLREAVALAHRFAVLEAGRVVQQGSLGDLSRAPATPFVRALIADLGDQMSQCDSGEKSPGGGRDEALVGQCGCVHGGSRPGARPDLCVRRSGGGRAAQGDDLRPHRPGTARNMDGPCGPDIAQPAERPRPTDEDGTSYRFPVCVVDAVVAVDLDLSVRFKPVSGAGDQAAGLVWRYRDPDNYYIVRANALENNVVLYKVEKGKRTDLDPRGGAFAYGKKARVPSGTWSTLRVVARERSSRPT